MPTKSYTRGNDLSGSLEGAGGIGGLLALTLHALPSIERAYYHADGNGNVTALVDDSQRVAARYIYDPFGNTLSASGPAAELNLYRFSSKELHAASGLVYYLYRFYEPNLQRWSNRDPIHEFGFLDLKGELVGFHLGSELNLYAVVGNNAVDHIDAVGLKKRVFGLAGGKCCNYSGSDQWWLDGDAHTWNKLPNGECTGVWDDCDGVTMFHSC